MTFLTGLLTAVFGGLVTWQLAGSATGNLPSSTARTIAVGLTVLACILGFLAGSALASRAQRTRDHLALFGSTAFAVALGVVSGAGAVLLLAGYLQAYGASPGSTVDLIVTALAFPVFALLGFALGALTGAVLGALLSGALRFLRPSLR